MNHSIVPNNKHDIEACNYLSQASDKNVNENLSELFEWLQDVNWPVAFHVINRIKKLDKTLSEPIKEILNSSDGGWKYNIISHLIADTSITTRLDLKLEIQRLIDKPTPDDIKEEVNIVAKELFDEIYKNV